MSSPPEPLSDEEVADVYAAWCDDLEDWPQPFDPLDNEPEAYGD